MSDVKKTWSRRNDPMWTLGKWRVRYHTYSNGETICFFGGKHQNLNLMVPINDAADCHDLIRVLQEVHNEMCRREANPGTTDRKGWSPGPRFPVTPPAPGSYFWTFNDPEVSTDDPPNKSQ